MSAVYRLEELNRDVFRFQQARVVASAQELTGDSEGSRKTINEAWEPLNNVPGTMIAGALRTIGLGIEGGDYK